MKTKLLEINNNRGIFVDKASKKIAIMIGGFERATTTEKKFKELADKVLISSFRFDYSGIGLSDGDFRNMTVHSMQEELKGVIKNIGKNNKEIIIVSHSLSACVITEMDFYKKVFISPAFNQKELLRYYFTLSKWKGDKKIDWDNYRDYFNEKNFLEDCMKEGKMTKSNFISSGYFMENKDKDYSAFIKDSDHVLYIHGDKDEKVPMGSINMNFSNSIIVKDGDHDLERPDMMNQWIKKVVEFI